MQKEEQEYKVKKFGTFGGVFTPTLLTILGVIMYLRLGWVVGNAGLLGAWIIIILSFTITLTTALSMSSITTNIRIGAGGAYAIISQSLGLEVGGSLGIPLYISQGLAITMYIFGFREGWLSIYPDHPAFAVDLIVFAVIYGISYKSADLAIRTQYLIMAVIVASLVVVVIAAYDGSMHYSAAETLRWGTFRGSSENQFSGSDFWIVFAVFFPAATGIMAGANMSGELKNPRKSIPIGTLWAIAISFVIYIGLAYWIGRSASEQELLSNYNIIIEKSFFPPLVIAGILGATFSSALASMVGASRILYAMGSHAVLPGSDWLKKQNSAGQPQNSMFVTGIIVFITMLLRNLNAVAPLVTMFFLITYAMINLVVIVEQKLGLISFRPLFIVSHWIPWSGLLSSVLAMFIINPSISLVSIALVILFYGILSQRKLITPFEDVRSGLFISFAEWAAKHTAMLSFRQERAWKPNLLVPVSDPTAVKGIFSFLVNISFPKGSIKLLGISEGENDDLFRSKINELSKAFYRKGVFSSWAVIQTSKFAEGVNLANQAYQGSFFKPNIVFLNILDKDFFEQDYRQVIRESSRLQLGILIYYPNNKTGVGQRQLINVWIRNRAPHWKITWDIGNLDLSILIAYKLKMNWNARIRLIMVVENEEQEKQAFQFMSELIDLARLPKTEITVHIGSFIDFAKDAPEADLNIFGLTPEPSFDFMEDMVEDTSTTCLFIRDSGAENILA
ncbi:amino acid permease [Mangrovibacterium marinum]|uniref:Cation-chloride cotransporter (CCC family) n=1 Tax=Mangrovibacterium marinum TaxID=1639118 RepID=A0A2T5C3Q1_9BACT|nr:amino acid permease [Mangrovibacterium marinum]PTN09366.1 cation-chloride cotransporter (CCC family) [Mangrovibacterium marinum]